MTTLFIVLVLSPRLGGTSMSFAEFMRARLPSRYRRTQPLYRPSGHELRGVNQAHVFALSTRA